ncbi:hypothetical protein Trydic_g8678 [Trypoxylus dichotomus]
MRALWKMGLQIDSKQKWTAHIDIVKKVITHHTTRAAYFATFHSMLNHSILFCGCPPSHLEYFFCKRRQFDCCAAYDIWNVVGRNTYLNEMYILRVLSHVHRNRDHYSINGLTTKPRSVTNTLP